MKLFITHRLASGQPGLAQTDTAVVSGHLLVDIHPEAVFLQKCSAPALEKHVRKHTAA